MTTSGTMAAQVAALCAAIPLFAARCCLQPALAAEPQGSEPALRTSASGASEGFIVPEWAYPGNPPQVAAEAPSDDDALLRVPDSPATFTRAQVRDLFAPPDWHPGTHPLMPDIVAHGRQPDVHACGYCHLPDGTGRPENAPLAGLPAAYIEQQVAAIRAGTRRSAWSSPLRPVELMRAAAEHATTAEIASAADYFSRLPLSRRVEVVETDRVPVTRAAGWLCVLTEGASTEPLGQRLIEVAIDHRRHELRDAASGYRAYVPSGSIARGRDLVVRGGDGLTTPCAGCHGAGLRGAGLVPPLAGRSPSYVLRQLFAFRTGARSAPSGSPMTPVVARLEVEDMIAIAAYVAAQAP
jgi:cytochrome c553